jgi:hypothetical protein
LDIPFFNNLKNKEVQTGITLFLDIEFYWYKNPIKNGHFEREKEAENDFFFAK